MTGPILLSPILLSSAVPVLAVLALVLAALPAGLALANLRVLRTPRAVREEASVSILIPARDEAPRIRETVAAALAAGGCEVIVADDGSTDGTDALVRTLMAGEPRLRLIAVPPLPPDWTGKNHACHHLAEAALGEHLLFIDADVRLGPGAAAALAGAARESGAALLSAVPRQITKGLGELVTVPAINLLLLAYLPIPLMRRRPDPSLGAACGQLVLVERAAYRACGGHGAIRTSLHDGVALPRLMRRAGSRTDLLRGAHLATCRMYGSFGEAWAGFSKNAREGMATPRALPVWTVLLFCGHVLPFLLLLAPSRPVPAIAAAVLSLGTRAAITAAGREHPLTILLHPATVLVALAIQWTALLRGRRPPAWKGRLYPGR